MANEVSPCGKTHYGNGFQPSYPVLLSWPVWSLCCLFLWRWQRRRGSHTTCWAATPRWLNTILWWTPLGFCLEIYNIHFNALVYVICKRRAECLKRFNIPLHFPISTSRNIYKTPYHFSVYTCYYGHKTSLAPLYISFKPHLPLWTQEVQYLIKFLYPHSPL